MHVKDLDGNVQSCFVLASIQAHVVYRRPRRILSRIELYMQLL